MSGTFSKVKGIKPISLLRLHSFKQIRKKNYTGNIFFKKNRPLTESKTKIQPKDIKIPLFEQERKWFALEILTPMDKHIKINCKNSLEHLFFYKHTDDTLWRICPIESWTILNNPLYICLSDLRIITKPTNIITSTSLQHL